MLKIAVPRETLEAVRSKTEEKAFFQAFGGMDVKRLVAEVEVPSPDSSLGSVACGERSEPHRSRKRRKSHVPREGFFLSSHPHSS